jgi:hypothetical protein
VVSSATSVAMAKTIAFIAGIVKVDLRTVMVHAPADDKFEHRPVSATVTPHLLVHSDESESKTRSSPHIRQQ